MAMRTESLLKTLTDEQRHLVKENIPLVAHHINRRRSSAKRFRVERDWDDLFQEGCLGLIRAAKKFDPDGNIPFAAFAIPRIHQAISQILDREGLIAPPPRKRDAARHRRAAARAAIAASEVDPDASAPTASPRHKPGFGSLDRDGIERDHRRSPSGPDTDGVETVGDRVRSRFQRAVHDAVDELAESRSRSRNDRKTLLTAIAERRLFVARPDYRATLRSLARETESSYARVVQSDARLLREVERAMQSDVELAALVNIAAASKLGMRRPLDAEVEARCGEVFGARLLDELDSAGCEQRANIVLAILEALAGDGGLRAILAPLIEFLTAEQRERVRRSVKERSRTAVERSARPPRRKAGSDTPHDPENPEMSRGAEGDPTAEAPIGLDISGRREEDGGDRPSPPRD